MSTVLISGVFDPLHGGHIAYLSAAERISGSPSEITVAVSDDESKHPPLVPLIDRTRILGKYGYWITTAPVADAIRTYRPDVFLKGREWEGKLPAGIVAACEEVDTRIEYCDTRENSSSALLADYERKRNTEKLAAFEAFVQAQKPADKPWEPVTDYSWETRREIEKPHAEIIKATFPDCTVLDYGCGFGYLVKLLQQIGVNAVGYDPQRPEFPECRQSDLVICREVLEHLTVTTLAEVVRDLAFFSKRYIYVTTRFCARPHLLDVDGADDLDPTHITMLNQDLLRTLFVLEGCSRRADLEQALDWQQKGRVLVYEVPRG